jgi:hypothetical protein
MTRTRKTGRPKCPRICHRAGQNRDRWCVLAAGRYPRQGPPYPIWLVLASSL